MVLTSPPSQLPATGRRHAHPRKGGDADDAGAHATHAYSSARHSPLARIPGANQGWPLSRVLLVPVCSQAGVYAGLGLAVKNIHALEKPAAAALGSAKDAVPRFFEHLSRDEQKVYLASNTLMSNSSV